MIERKLYYLMMVAGYLAVFIMLSIIIVGVMSLSGCSLNNIKELPDKPVHSTQLCCVPDAVFPHSCDGFLLCKENDNG